MSSNADRSPRPSRRSGVAVTPRTFDVFHAAMTPVYVAETAWCASSRITRSGAGMDPMRRARVWMDATNTLAGADGLPATQNPCWTPTAESVPEIWSMISCRWATTATVEPRSAAALAVSANRTVFPEPVGETARTLRFPAENDARRASRNWRWYGLYSIMLPCSARTVLVSC